MLRLLAEEILDNAALRAVWLDAGEHKVSYALQPGLDSSDTRSRVSSILREHPPLDGPASCEDGALPGNCARCSNAAPSQLPRGVRMVAMPSGIMLERESCATAVRFWQWEQITWRMKRRRALGARGASKAADAGAEGEPHAHASGQSHGHSHGEDWVQAAWLAGTCGLLALVGLLLQWQGYGGLALALYLAAYVAGAWHPAQEVWEVLRKGKLDVHFLMLSVAVGAAAIGHWWEGAFLLFLFSGSDALEDLAMSRTERELKSLFKEAPETATQLLPDGTESTVGVEEIRAGMKIRVRPGDQFPVDAEVLVGSSAANEASLTGESLPVDKLPGSHVYSGTMNLWGSLDCRVVRAAQESSLAKIIHLIQEAQESKAPAQRFTDLFGTRYTYGVLAATAAGFLVWWLVLGIPPFISAPGETSAFYRAMTLLVVASPCALVLSIPSAVLAGIAAAARRGILFRGGAALERLAEIKRVALDKTGTLTTGELAIEAVETLPPGREDELLRAASALSHHSTHPVSRAIAQHAKLTLGSSLAAAEGFRSLTGLGLEGTLADGRTVRLGRRSLFLEQQGQGGSAGATGEHTWVAALPEPPIGVTETLVVCGDLRGRILLRDSVRENGAALLQQLYAQGLAVTMLTGDRQEAAAHVAEQLGLREFRAGLKPEEKVAAIQAWEAAGEHVAMVGDGVNDAPSLAAAHVAVGMGLRGSDAVLEQADVVLMQDKLENFNTAYLLSRRANAIIKQNLAISMGVIALLVIGAMGGKVPLALGVLGHEGSTVVVVLNSMRLLFFGKGLPWVRGRAA